MDPFVFAAVLFAAACHAGWNALIKFGLEPFLSQKIDHRFLPLMAPIFGPLTRR